jgi:hypothetical protein
MPRPLALAAASLLAALALAGCGDEEDSPEIDAAIAAAEALTASGTAHAEISMEGEVPGEQIGFEGFSEMDFDTEETQGEFVYDELPGVPSGTRAEIYSKGTELFARYDFLPAGQWVRLPADPFSAFSPNPSGIVSALDVALEDVEPPGEESIDGEPMTVYEGSFDIGALVATAPEADQEQLEEELAVLDDLEGSLTLYVDSDDVLRRTDYDLSALLPDGSSMLASVEFSELGEPVSFDPPRPQDIRDLDELAAGDSS